MNPVVVLGILTISMLLWFEFGFEKYVGKFVFVVLLVAAGYWAWWHFIQKPKIENQIIPYTYQNDSTTANISGQFSP